MKNTVVVPEFGNEEEKKSYVAECDRGFERLMDEKLSSVTTGKIPRFIGLTGPTCSGKTTAAKKMIGKLRQKGYRVHSISVDDFYYTRDELLARAEKSGDDKIDYDSEETIDLPFLAGVVASISAGKETRLPHFNFETGLRESGEVILPEENDVFLFEGIQIFYPGVRALLERERYHTIVICPQSSIQVRGISLNPNEIRFLRRLVRDARHRGTDPEFNFLLWEGVRENEEKNIFPYLGSCRTQIDSTLGYELGMLRPYLIPLMTKVAESGSRFRNHAGFILSMLEEIESVSSDYLSENSLYKEFI